MERSLPPQALRLWGISRQKGQYDPMTQAEKRLFLIKALIRERSQDIVIPVRTPDQKRLLRSLMNVRPPWPVSEEFLRIQDEYLQAELLEKDITSLADLTPMWEDLYLWQGDITTLKCDAIVNAANSQMLGCFYPCHGCIDNAIHTYSGIQLRLACASLMEKQRHEEPTGKAKITPAYNLPCKFVVHTVGPIIEGKPSKRDEELLASCYRSCLRLAEDSGAKSVAFCCISTGEFHFPNERAAEIAIEAVKTYKQGTQSEIKVIFNVFKEIDLHIYQKLLGSNQAAQRGNGSR